MNIDGFWQVFGVGALGGFALELLRWWRSRFKATKEIVPQSVALYLVISLLMIGMSGLVATFHGTENRNPLTVFQLGLTVPAMIGIFAAGKSNEMALEGAVPKRTASPQDIVDFLAFRG